MVERVVGAAPLGGTTTLIPPDKANLAGTAAILGAVVAAAADVPGIVIPLRCFFMGACAAVEVMAATGLLATTAGVAAVATAAGALVTAMGTAAGVAVINCTVTDGASTAATGATGAVGAAGAAAKEVVVDGLVSATTADAGTG